MTKASEGVQEPDLAAAIVLLAERLGGNQDQLNATLAALRESQPPRQVTFGDEDYQAKLLAETKVFPRPVYQGGREANPSGLSDDVLRKVGELKAGTYLGGFVTIRDTPQKGIDFYYRNATPDQRMAQMQRFTSFAELVEKCWAEMPKTTAAA